MLIFMNLNRNGDLVLCGGEQMLKGACLEYASVQKDLSPLGE